MTLSRETVRKALATALTTALPSAQVVYNHMKGGFAGQSPVVRVMSDGSDRLRFTPRGGRGDLYMLVQFWVMYAAPKTGWTEADAEDALDQLEWELAQYIDANRKTDHWQAIDFDGRSKPDLVRLEGEAYLVENIPLKLKVY